MHTGDGKQSKGEQGQQPKQLFVHDKPQTKSQHQDKQAKT